MKIEITNINISYQDGTVGSVQVYFNGYDEERTTNLNGYLPLTAEEYSGNESIGSLVGLVTTNLANKLAV